MDLKEMQIIRSKRKTAAIQVTREGKVVVRVPEYMPESDIFKMVRKNHGWIRKHMEKVQNGEPEVKERDRISPEEAERLKQDAVTDLAMRTRYYSRMMGVDYGRITIRMQKTRWGSCTSTGNLNFNCLLMLTPPEVRDYVVVHELCHRKEMNHSKAFWAEVEKILPDYKEQKQWLKENGEDIMLRAFT